MAKISRNSLQWQTAITTFTSIMIAGLVAIAISVSAFYSQVFQPAIPEIEILLYHGLAIVSLLFLALLYSVRTYLTLSRPLDNLDQITQALPLLSSKQYDEAKKRLQYIARSTEHQEINGLQDASCQLANLLEKLEMERVKRTLSINAKNSELQTERDFVKSLVNTAQLIIITVNDAFEITLFNHHGEQLTGLPEETLLHTNVARMFPSGNWTETHSLFEELLAGTMPIAQQDAELIDANGNIRHIAWLHSPIALDGNKTSILSVGMDMTEKKEAEQRIVWLAQHDPLTDLCNRRRFTEEFEKSLQTAIRYKHKNTLLFLDLDQFKDIKTPVAIKRAMNYYN